MQSAERKAAKAPLWDKQFNDVFDKALSEVSERIEKDNRTKRAEKILANAKKRRK